MSEETSASGLEAILDVINKLYPDQENHVQTNALIKFWMGGPDPLDYVSILNNAGDRDMNVPPHWHYISFGFSDLYGDGRIHKFKGPNKPSGFGFELTFRLRKTESTENEAPPMWPARLMNALAKYVFQTGTVLNCNDHIPWTRPLDESLSEPVSIVQHMLIAEDPQMATIKTPHGHIHFRQIIGITEDELKSAQQWNGYSILQFLARSKETAGPWFVTDMKRRRSIYEINPMLKNELKTGIATDGSNLGSITASFKWVDAENNSNIPNNNTSNQKSLKMINLDLHRDTAELMPLIIKGRLNKGRFFRMESAEGQGIMFIPPGFKAEFIQASEQNPLLATDKELQIYCSESFQEEMALTMKPLDNMSNISSDPPTIFQLHNPIIKLSVVPESQLPSLVK